MGSKKNVTISSSEDTVKIVQTDEAGEVTTQDAKAKAPKVARLRGKQYTAMRAQVDKTKSYEPHAAIDLIKKLSYSKFAGTISADVVVKDANTQIEIAFPHSIGKQTRVAIVDDQLITEIEAGKIGFDVLVTEPRFMPKLAKLAKVLGPKGLMPNPKNGTVTNNPELKKKELEGGKMTLKGEKKAPLMHVNLGKTDMETAKLAENLESLIKVLGGKIVRLFLSATMSPSVRVKID